MKEEKNAMSDHDQNTGGTGQNSDEPVLTLQKIYIKDCSFESPNSPAIFQGKWEPKIILNLNTTSNQIAPDTLEVVLAVTLEAKIEESTAFLIELEQAGIFTIKNYDQEAMKHLIANRCPSMLYAYVREAISELVSKGGFPQLLLQPMDFDALYAHADAEQNAESETQGNAPAEAADAPQ